MENTNGDEGVAIGDSNTRPEGAAFDENIARPEATLSAEEFHRLQEQLLELRNRNYELIEENKRQQTYINALPSKGIETLNFASKLMGRRRDKEGTNEKLEYEIHVLRSKLSSQEEEFRLQQSTLLSELNKAPLSKSFKK
ncbi:unnamed protein product [Toxocara canis]|uniref:Cnn_1N domain-containing protein n=1 Tax=Toxocara canis TaxID=6265 RepID=A0A183UTC5_TOXCA|nr:unnamed protein product [Toxocara canis]